MGSFDAVCGLSNMAISPDQPVVTMVIRRNPYAPCDMPIYPFDEWQPASPLVRGRYNDYGGVAIDEKATAQWQSTQEVSRQWWNKVLVRREGEVDSISYTRGKLEFPYSIDGAQQTPDRREGHHNPYAIWMSHEGIFDHLRRDVVMEDWNTADQRMIYTPMGDWVEEMANRARRVMSGEAVDQLTVTLKQRLGEDYLPAMRSTRSPWDHKGRDSHTPIFDHWDRQIWGALDRADIADMNRLIDEWIDTTTLMFILTATRRLLCNPGTIGEQHGHDQPLTSLAAAITAQAEINRQRYEEDD